MKPLESIPLVDVKGQYLEIRLEILAKIEEVIESTAFIQGRFVAEFEREFCRMHGLAHGAGCSNGTSAIFLALAGLGIGPGDEVITTTNTFVATGEAICHAGAKPVYVDIDTRTWNIDLAKAEKAITKRTKAIIPVHLYGNPCDMQRVTQLAKAHGLRVIEDCAQAHFATAGGSYVGTFGDAATFSFYPGKNLGAYGDAGFVASRTKDLDDLVHRLLDHGRTDKYSHDIVGHNHRMDGIQAGILSVKLRHITKWTERRREVAAAYDRRLKPAGFQVLESVPGALPVYHLYPVQVSNRDDALVRMKAAGIGAAIHYPIPLHLQPAFAYLGYKRGDMPIAESHANRVMSLPICGRITDEQVERITEEFLKVANV
jgi:dTDP-4-amino-4,6-dideoxygalactose transaminase